MNTERILFTPIKIGNMEVKNRIVFPPMVTGHAGPDGKVTDAHIAWYEARARGGVGLIIVEFTAVMKSGSVAPVALGMWDDAFIPGFQELTNKVHTCDARIFLQLSHAGRQTNKAFTGGKLSVSPSAISCPMGEPMTKEIPKELDLEEIEEIIDRFGQAARRAREAGFDGVEVHGAHGYLISAFMSAYTNKRHDAYGGDLEGRMQFPLQIIRRIRKQVGRDFPMSFRYSGNEYVPDGRTIEESRRIAPMLVAAGVDCLHISAGVYESFWSQIPPHGTREGVNADDAAAVKGAVKVPVITVGRIKSPGVAEEILAQGKADMVAMGRQLICDPEWPLKVAAGESEDIRPCIGCTQSCINRGIVEGRPVSCIYNTAAGREKQAGIRRAERPKKVLVVGGGPGGLEAARVAALRGHQVALFEKSKELGGRFNLACIPPFKQEFATAIKWLSRQINKLGVHVELNKEVTPELVDEIGPDAVILATGAVTRRPSVPGIDREKVVLGEDILAGRVTLGNRVLIVGGGGIGTEVADFIAQRGKDVTIVEMLPEIGAATGIPVLVAQILIPRLKSYGVKMMTNASVKEITGEAVVVKIGGREEIIEGIDQVIIAAGARSVNELSGKLEGRVPEIYTIGDAKEPRTVFEATQEAAEAAGKI
jgi:2,4-dienoyl-CoA reductase-like NADH-dependent reductase (Old Yellow Enzyme family)/thioredoxin reductase